MTWEKDIKRFNKDMGRFRKQEGRSMSFALVFAYQLEQLEQMADDGSEPAQHTAEAIKHWAQGADANIDHGVLPTCVCCNAMLEHGEVGAFGVLAPVEDKGVGVTAAFCSDCAHKHPAEELQKRFAAALDNDIGVQMVHTQ